MAFKKATKEQAKLRASFFGPSGSGKTFTALRVAKGIAEAIGSSVGVIDTERGSASKYADRFDFVVEELQDKTIDSYVHTMNEAAAAGIGVLILDSLSHGWQELLTEIDKLARAKYKGNTWSAWSEGTPKQRELVDAILNYPGHIIATMRSKTEWTTEEGRGGKSRPVRVGLAPEQGKGIEYEFDLLLEISTDHIANVIKDRTGKWQDQMIDKPGEDFGRELAAWLSDGTRPTDPMQDVNNARQAIAAAMRDRGWGKGVMVDVSNDWLKQVDAEDLDATSAKQRKAFIEDIKAGRWDPQPEKNENPTAGPDASSQNASGQTGQSVPANSADPATDPSTDDQSWLDDAVAAMGNAKTMQELKEAYAPAYKRANEAGDKRAIEMLTTLKDAQKAEIQEAEAAAAEAI